MVGLKHMTVGAICSLSPLVAHAAGISEEQADTVTGKIYNEIVVSGDSPKVMSDEGAISVDLPAMVKDRPVSNILEAMAYLPGAKVSQGLFSGLAGVPKVTIIINGELSAMPAASVYRLLYATPVSRLLKAEIMYNAPAKYHVNGAVVNIVLKTPRPIDGLQGQVNAQLNQAERLSAGSGLAATYATGRWTFDGNYSFAYAQSVSERETVSDHLIGLTRTRVGYIDTEHQNSKMNSVYLSAGYKIKDNSNIILTYNTRINSDIHVDRHNAGSMGYSLTCYDYPEPIVSHYLSLRYQSPFGLKLTCAYTYYGENRDVDRMDATGNVVAAWSNRQRGNRIVVQADNAHKINSMELNYGVGYRHVSDHSRQLYSQPAYDGFDSRLNENVVDGYVGIQGKFPFGMSFSASAKMECYMLGNVRRWNFIPQLGISYARSPSHMFQLNFTSYRSYPSFWELRDGVSMINGYAAAIGNPELTPYTSYSMQLSYIFKRKYVATLYNSYIPKYALQLPYQLPDELRLVYQTRNMDYMNVAGLNLHVPFNIGKTVNSALSVNTYYYAIKCGDFYGIPFSRGRMVCSSSLNVSVKPTATSPVAIALEGAYVTPSMQGLYDISSAWRVNAGLKWVFGGRNAEVNLMCRDIFSTWRPTTTVSHCGQMLTMRTLNRSFSINLAFTWRFNGFRQHNTDVDTSRFGTGQ